MSKYVLVLSCLVLLFLAACSPAVTPDLSSLFPASCDAPCWHEVIPGKTTKNELEKLIPGFPYYSPEQIAWREGIYQSGLYMDMNVADDWAGIEIHLIRDTVQYTRIYSKLGPRGLRDLGYSLADILDLYGEPEQVVVGRGCGGDQYCINLNLVYPEIGVIVSVASSDDPANLRLLPSLPVRQVFFVYPPAVMKVLGDRVELISNSCDLEASAFQWSGYATIHMDSSCH